MPSLDLLIPFIVASAVFAFMPGPGMLYAATQTVARGRRAGWYSAVGLHIGGYVHILAAAFGLAALLETIPTLYTVVKFAGAAYLVWLGVRLFVSREAPARSLPDLATRETPPALRDSVIVEVLNPKTALFFLAFLPQFTDVDAAFPVWLQIAILGTIVNVMFSTTDVLCVLLAHRMRRFLGASTSLNRFARRVGGGILVGLGVNLAISRQ